MASGCTPVSHPVWIGLIWNGAQTFFSYDIEIISVFSRKGVKGKEDESNSENTVLLSLHGSTLGYFILP